MTKRLAIIMSMVVTVVALASVFALNSEILVKERSVVISIDKYEYALGEPVKFSVTYTGTGKTMYFHHSRSLIIEDLKGNLIHVPNWVDAMGYLESGHKSHHIWDQRDVSNYQVPPGVYVINSDFGRSESFVIK